jgi:transcriptional regulator with XRE-family HTH domain
MNENQLAENLGNFIAKVRKMKGLSQAALGSLSNTSEVTIRRLESGKGLGTGFGNLLAISQALNLSFPEMMYSLTKGEIETNKMNSRWDYLSERINRFTPTQKDWITKIIEDILDRP